ncbi:serine/threonine protein kinase [Buchananella hordeovulneris]|uniref:serine/threonine-protein kinase n=1 Tax=Buchananella hordeovulneris TaxID=52770 RepID=UPI000F5E3129|nr:serine/threonine-protein kinase [Buchananella hordeovulneris]RRD52935.1 serine/threonine protein kinase [Buchananella hordeovulneris]
MTTEDGPRALGSRYVLTRRIGQGASGEVWLAHDLTRGVDVAAKLLWPEHSNNPEVVARFVQERNLLRSLTHPLIVKVHDLVVEGTTLAIVMDLVQGPSLNQLLGMHGPLAVADAVTIIRGVLSALGAAHAAGVVHRDVKADNVLLTTAHGWQGKDVRLADFGIAAIVREDTGNRTEAIGTPNYMAPELIAYGKSGPASDIYSAGILFYALIAGRTPFAEPSNPHVVYLHHVQHAPPPLPIDPALWRVISGMLAKNPAHRLPAHETLAALNSLPVSAFTTPPLPVQPVPEQWEEPEVPLPSKEQVVNFFAATQPVAPPLPPPTEVPALADADPDATSLNSHRTPREVSVPASLRLSTPVDDGNRTQLGGFGKHQIKLEETEEAPKSRRRRWLLVAGALATVLAVTFVVLWLTGSLGSAGPAAKPEVEVTTAPAQLTGEVLPSGLRTDLRAQWDKQAGLTQLAVTYSAAPGTKLSGETLLVIPALEPGACPQVSGGSELTPIKASSDGLRIECGYKVTLPLLERNKPHTVDLTVKMDMAVPGPDGQEAAAPADYSQWLAALMQTTDTGLEQVTGPVFALQRVEAIEVSAESVSLTGQAGVPVPYQVKARWRAKDQSQALTELFTPATLDGSETRPLLDLTGGEGLDAVQLSTCNEAQIIGIRVLAEQPSRTCFVQVELGVFDAAKATFETRLR